LLVLLSSEGLLEGGRQRFSKAFLIFQEDPFGRVLGVPRLEGRCGHIHPLRMEHISKET
jgi:hypothetical protein